MSRRLSATAALAIALESFGSASLMAAGLRYRIEAIGPVPTTDQYVEAVGGLNNHGDVAFNYERTVQIAPSSSERFADSYVATAAGMISIPKLGGNDARAYDLTDNGLVVGSASSADTYPSYPGAPSYEPYFDPFISQRGQTSAIPTPERGVSYAAAANERGEVVGSNSSDQGNLTVFKWSASGGYKNLGEFGAYLAYPVDINERSDILINVTPNDILQFGESYQYRGTKAILYNAGSITQIPDSEFGITYGSAVNDNGVVVGAFGSIPGRESHAFIWDEIDGFRDLGQKDEFSYALDVNNAGVVIGAAGPAYEQPTAPWIYTKQAGRQRLIDLIDNPDDWSLESVMRINDRGQIAGIGWGTGGRRVFLATPIPEPSTMSLWLLAWFCVVMASRQRLTRR